MIKHREGKHPNWPTWRDCWQRIYTRLQDQAPGFFLSYDELETLTASTRPRAQAALRRARRELQRTHERWLVCEPERGYRLIEAREHAGVAQGYRSQARRKLRTGLALTVHVKLDEITNPLDRQQLERAQGVLKVALAFVDQVAKLKQLPARTALRLPSSGELLHMIDRTRRANAKPA